MLISLIAIGMIVWAFLIYEMVTAKMGYEDQSGYHDGEPPENYGKTPRCPKGNDHMVYHELVDICPEIYECGCGTLFWWKDAAHWEIIAKEDLEKWKKLSKTA